MEALKKLIFKESVPFTKKKDLNASGILKLAIGAVLIAVVCILIMPGGTPEQTTFQEKVDAAGTVISRPRDNDPTNQAIAELKASQANLRDMPRAPQFTSSYGGGMGSGGKSGGGADRNVSMIVSRGGSDTRNALSVGTRIGVILTEALTIGNQTVPVTGLVSGDVTADSSLAIPEGSKVIGEASFDKSSGRANLSWKTIILPDGRERVFAAISIGSDNQVGVEGNVKSEALKNTIGQTLTGFIGAYAQGAMSSGMLGANEGGVQNGLKSAIAQTAKDRANSFGEDMKKEHKWIELSRGTSLVAVLGQSFVFRDPGSTYGH